MSRATLVQLLWWLAAWNLGSFLEFALGGRWTLVGIAAGSLLVLALRLRALPLHRASSVSGQA
ncbi:MAG: hypothetical protein A2V85_14735 [Chloroflexi bacterium RBG_16_72_14]|nr:MAG: hypothetical protein A2V85_14735 [Chloroflexi bacterium RBG_16_72_14]